MTSQKDRVVRVRTAPDTTMPEHRSRRVFTWVSMSEGNSCTMKHQNDVWFYLKLTRALILICALVENSLTELTGGQQH